MGKKVKFFKLTGGAVLKNSTIKNGLDTSRLINLIVCIKDPKKFKIKGFSFPPNLFFIHEVSFSEAVGILVNKFNFTQQKAVSEVRLWKKELQTNEIKKDNVPKEYEDIVRKTNERIVEEKGEDYRIGDPDIIIIAGFLKEKIEIIHVKDKGFEETCKRLNLNVIAISKEELILENKIKKKLIK